MAQRMAPPHVTQFDLLDQLNTDESSWFDMRNFPSTITCRRMLRLANFAAANPKRWMATYYWHVLDLDADVIAVRLGISRATVYNYLQPIRMDDDSDYPDEI